jgi:hypothetical protein
MSIMRGGYCAAMTETSEHAAPAPVPVIDLSDDVLLRELESLHRTRNETLRHGSEDALKHHTDRLRAMETEYLRRFPGREIDAARTKAGRA